MLYHLHIDLPSTMCSFLPTPPLKIIGIDIILLSLSNKLRSIPLHMPSLSIEVIKSSPAPNCSASFAHLITSSPDFSLPLS